VGIEIFEKVDTRT